MQEHRHRHPWQYVEHLASLQVSTADWCISTSSQPSTDELGPALSWFEIQVLLWVYGKYGTWYSFGMHGTAGFYRNRNATTTV